VEVLLQIYLSLLSHSIKLRAFQLSAVTISLHYLQGRNEIRWRLGQESSLAPPCSKLRSFGSKCTVLKKVLVTLLGLFGAPHSQSAPPAVIRCLHSNSAPVELWPPFPPRYAPDYLSRCQRPTVTCGEMPTRY